MPKHWYDKDFYISMSDFKAHVNKVIAARPPSKPKEGTKVLDEDMILAPQWGNDDVNCLTSLPIHVPVSELNTLYSTCLVHCKTSKDDATVTALENEEVTPDEKYQFSHQAVINSINLGDPKSLPFNKITAEMIREDQLKSFPEIFEHFTVKPRDNGDKVSKATHDKYVLINNYVLAYYPKKFRRDATIKPKILLSETMTLNVMALMHCVSHTSLNQLLSQFSKQYYIKNKTYYGHVITSCCRVCARTKVPRSKDHIDGSLIRYSRPFEGLSIDFMKLNSCTYQRRKTNTILSITCQFSLLNMSIIVPDETAKSVINALENLLSTLPWPVKVILSDNQTSLCNNREVIAFCKARGIKCILTTPFASQGNSLVESSNKLMRKVIQRLQLMHNIENWSECFPLAKFIVNSLIRTYLKGTDNEFKLSAIQLVTGINPLSHFEALKDNDFDITKSIRVRDHYQKILDDHYKRLKVQQDERDTIFTSNIKIGDVCLIRRLPELKNEFAYRDMVFRVIDRKNRKVVLESMYGKKYIVRTHSKFVKKFSTSELINLLSPDLQKLYGHHYNLSDPRKPPSVIRSLHTRAMASKEKEKPLTRARVKQGGMKLIVPRTRALGEEESDAESSDGDAASSDLDNARLLHPQEKDPKGGPRSNGSSVGSRMTVSSAQGTVTRGKGKLQGINRRVGQQGSPNLARGQERRNIPAALPRTSPQKPISPRSTASTSGAPAGTPVRIAVTPSIQGTSKSPHYPRYQVGGFTPPSQPISVSGSKSTPAVTTTPQTFTPGASSTPQKKKKSPATGLKKLIQSISPKSIFGTSRRKGKMNVPPESSGARRKAGEKELEKTLSPILTPAEQTTQLERLLPTALQWENIPEQEKRVKGNVQHSPRVRHTAGAVNSPIRTPIGVSSRDLTQQSPIGADIYQTPSSTQVMHRASEKKVLTARKLNFDSPEKDKTLQENSPARVGNSPGLVSNRADLSLSRPQLSRQRVQHSPKLVDKSSADKEATGSAETSLNKSYAEAVKSPPTVKPVEVKQSRIPAPKAGKPKEKVVKTALKTPKQLAIEPTRKSIRDKRPPERFTDENFTYQISNEPLDDDTLHAYRLSIENPTWRVQGAQGGQQKIPIAVKQVEKPMMARSTLIARD
jgi:hypothetical protein